MKDYAYSIDNKINEDYYLYYEKKDDKIIVYLSNGTKREFVYTEEIEQKILERMEFQVKKYGEDYIDIYDEEYRDIIKRTFPFILFSSFGSIAFQDSNMLFSIINYTILGVGTFAFGYGGIGHISSSVLRKDYEKHKLYLDNKDLIQSGSYNDLRPLKGINKKALKEASSNIKNNQKAININTIRLLSHDEIKGIIEKIQEKTYTLKR